MRGLIHPDTSLFYNTNKKKSRIICVFPSRTPTKPHFAVGIAVGADVLDGPPNPRIDPRNISLFLQNSTRPVGADVLDGPHTKNKVLAFCQNPTITFFRRKNISHRQAVYHTPTANITCAKSANITEKAPRLGCFFYGVLDGPQYALHLPILSNANKYTLHHFLHTSAGGRLPPLRLYPPPCRRGRRPRRPA